MTLDEFVIWLNQNPDEWRTIGDPIWNRLPPAYERHIALPAVYESFLDRIGPIFLEKRGYSLIGRKEINEVAAFMCSLNYPDEGVLHEHLSPFCSLNSNSWYYCFDQSAVVMFDALEPCLYEDIVADSFEQFLREVLLVDFQL